MNIVTYSLIVNAPITNSNSSNSGGNNNGAGNDSASYVSNSSSGLSKITIIVMGIAIPIGFISTYLLI